MSKLSPIFRHPGLVPYGEAFESMKAFSGARGTDTPDEIWFLEHPPVYTLGLGGRHEHLLETGGIPVVRADRGGQVTYHGPGQLVAYTLLDLKRSGLGIRSLVDRLEQSVIDLLHEFGIGGERRAGAPGVYVNGAKIAALGVRVRRGCCYHGLALNVSMDLAPFRGIHPCGYEGLAVTQLADLGVHADCKEIARRITPYLLANLYANVDHAVIPGGRSRPSMASAAPAHPCAMSAAQLARPGIQNSVTDAVESAEAAILS